MMPRKGSVQVSGYPGFRVSCRVPRKEGGKMQKPLTALGDPAKPIGPRCRMSHGSMAQLLDPRQFLRLLLSLPLPPSSSSFIPLYLLYQDPVQWLLFLAVLSLLDSVSIPLCLLQMNSY